MRWFEPYLVVGPGRSGTSTVARVLHELLGVHMGDTFRAPDETNPRGFFEDLWYKDNNEAWISGRLDTGQWRTSFARLLVSRRSQGAPWGLKDPRTAHVLGLVEPFVQFSRVIRCRRPRAQVVESMRRCYGWRESVAGELVDERECALDELAPLLEVDMGAHPSDEDLVALLGGVIHE